MNALAQLRIAALVEGISFVLLLFVAMPLKYVAGLTIAVRIAGSVHGFSFLWFVSALFRASDERRWTLRTGLSLFAWSLVPFGALVVDRTIRYELARSERAPCAPVRDEVA